MAPLLVAFGVRPVQAVVIPLIAHLWAKFFGTLGVSWFATLQVVDLAEPATTAFQSGLLLVIPCVLGGFTVVWIYGKWPAVRHAWPLVLIIAALGILTIQPLNDALRTLSIGMPFPAVTTGFGFATEASAPYSPFAPLTHPGTFLLAAALFGRWLFARRQRATPSSTLGTILMCAARDARPLTISVSALLVMSAVMSHSGEITVLALGLSNVAGSSVYLACANFIAMLGSLTTSSNTASNVLFAPLQATGAAAEGLPVSVALAAQAAGAAVGNAISPADALLGATTVKQPDLVGAILQRAVPWALATGLLIALATLGLA